MGIKLEIILALIIILSLLTLTFLTKEQIVEFGGIIWIICIMGFVAAIFGAYLFLTRAKIFGGILGSVLKLCAAGILLIGISSVICFLFHIISIENAFEISVQIEDTLRTAALIIFLIAGYNLPKNLK